MEDLSSNYRWEHNSLSIQIHHSPASVTTVSQVLPVKPGGHSHLHSTLIYPSFLHVNPEEHFSASLIKLWSKWNYVRNNKIPIRGTSFDPLVECYVIGNMILLVASYEAYLFLHVHGYRIFFLCFITWDRFALKYYLVMLINNIWNSNWILELSLEYFDS